MRMLMYTLLRYISTYLYIIGLNKQSLSQTPILKSINGMMKIKNPNSILIYKKKLTFTKDYS